MQNEVMVMDQMTHASRQTVAAFWATMQTNDFHGVGDLLADDYLLEWPQSGERIRGRYNFVAINQQYPAAGRWRFTIHHLLTEGHEVVSDVSVTDGVMTGQAITFSTVHASKIVRQVEFWPDPFATPAWRVQWVERMERSCDK